MERDQDRSGSSVSPWAQLALIAALFCLGRQFPPFPFANEAAVDRPPAAAPRRHPPRAAPRGPEVASLATPALAPAARPPRPRVRTRASAAPHEPAAEENPPAVTGVVSQVFPGLDLSSLPIKISGDDPQYTGPALDHEVEGVMRVACLVTVEGAVDRCRVVHGLPFMDVAVLKALRNRRYEPAHGADGRPVETEYEFVVTLLLRGELLL